MLGEPGDGAAGGTRGRPHPGIPPVDARQQGRDAAAVVGRETELEQLSGLLEAVAGGPQAILLEGEAGIGKTTVWAEGCRTARGLGFRVLTARPTEVESHLTFVGLADLLQPAVDDILADLPGPQRRALDVALARAEPERTAPDPRVLAAAVLSTLAGLASSSPLLIAVDDVQWLDRPTAGLLTFAGRRLSGPVGFMITVRMSDQSELPLGLDRALPPGRLHRLTLGPLSLGALHHVLASRLGTVLPRPTLVRIHRTSAGNPFYALELARAALQATGSTAGRLSVPRSLSDLVARRIQALPPSCQELLLPASALSRPTRELLRAATGADPGPSLRQAEAAGIIEVGERGQAVRFTHPVLAAAVYSAASPEQRGRLHGTLAEAVDDPHERIRHRALAAQGPDAALAQDVAEAAADLRRRGAPDAAAELARQARLLTPADRAEQAWRYSVDEASYRSDAGDTALAETILEELVSEAPPSVIRAEALWRLGLVRHRHDSVTVGLRLLGQSLDEAGDAPRLRSAIQRSLAWMLIVAGDMPTAAEHAQAGLALAELSDDEGALADALIVVVLAEMFLGRGVRHDLITRALALEDWAEGKPVEFRPSVVDGFVRKYEDDIDGARRSLQAVLHRLAETGDDSSLPVILFHLSELEIWAGRWEEASRLAADAMDVATQTGQEMIQHTASSARALLDTHLGRAEDARRAAQTAYEVFERGGVWIGTHHCAHVLGLLELSLDDSAAAHAHLAPAVERALAAGVGEPALLWSVPLEVEALVAIGRLAEAEDLLAPFEGRARALGRRRCLGGAARCRALLRAAEGDLDAALQAADQAVAAHGSLPMPFEQARSLLVKGRVLRRRKERRVARGTLEAALELFEGLGARLWAENVTVELQRVGSRAGSPHALTPTEERVATLAASGLTNREVARSLFMSPKTVEANLSRVYRKLGIRSRAELGARFATTPDTTEADSDPESQM